MSDHDVGRLVAIVVLSTVLTGALSILLLSLLSRLGAVVRFHVGRAGIDARLTNPNSYLELLMLT